MQTTILAALLVLAPAPQGVKKPVAQRPKSPLLGQVQMAGDHGKLGTAYSIGAKGDELNLTLESAAFVLRAPMASDLVLAKKDRKILLLTFSVANPQKRDMSLAWNSFALTAVSPDGENAEFDGYIYHPERKTRLDTTLKPAQNVRAILAFPIHARGPVDKLIVKRGGGKVLRYDLRGLVKPLAGTFAESGDTAVEKAGVDQEAPFDLGAAQWTVGAAEKMPEGVGAYKPDERYDVWGVTVTVKNPNLAPIKVGWNTVKPTMTDENGEPAEWAQDLLGMGSNRTLDDVEVASGDEIRGRYVFRLAKGARPKKMVMPDEETGRAVTISLR